MLRPFAHPVACCWMLLRIVGQSLKPVKLFSQQLLTFLLFLDRRSVAQQCWIRLHSSSNIVGATHAHYAWFTKTCDGLYPSHDALQVPTLLGVLLHPFAHHCQHARKNPSCPFARSLRQFLGFPDEFDNQMTFSKRLNRHCSIPTPFRRVKRKQNHQQFPHVQH